MLPIFEDHSIIMPKVKRHILGGATWELPAGGIKDRESEEEGALRELREETGIWIFDTSRLKKENYTNRISKSLTHVSFHFFDRGSYR